jgi:dUTP pyrophosphatase
MYQTRQSAGLDLAATESYILLPGDRALIDTGVYLKDVLPDAVKVQLNPNVVLCGMVCPRSGLATKWGITVLNAPGIVDLDYQDTIKVCLVNHGKEIFMVRIGDRIAQLVFSASYRRSELVKDEVRTGGHGSTGT